MDNESKEGGLGGSIYGPVPRSRSRVLTTMRRTYRNGSGETNDPLGSTCFSRKVPTDNYARRSD